ncbi:hypothetical protein [Pseudomonas guariconensis]|uniref:hypothetical protein n=1 Tax=Pseudomonas guariconensis TaxID=1288410 RepID=UPI0018D65592|nr:hypothetical protein [Pseudomonas guariconensis]MBH3360765.1 hypothetical protein [Pseudomonas guariconensis]
MLIVALIVLCIVLLTSLAQRLFRKSNENRSENIEEVPRESKWPFDLPDPHDPKNWGLSPSRPSMPRKRDVSAAEYEQASLLFRARLKANAMWSFELSRAKAMSIRSKNYRWRASGGATLCEYCKSKDGKIFAWNHAHEHPGYHQCSEEESCRCYAEPIIPS